MTYHERPVTFACEGETLVGMLSLPAAPNRTAVLIVVGGPQYRAGSHRQFVALARHLADKGYPVLRFDCRGMGDSTGAKRSFEDFEADISAALETLLATTSASSVVLWGLCDGASAALMYVGARSDARVSGLVVANPWVRTPAGLASAHIKHYYVRRVLEPAFWTKLLRGGVGIGAITGLALNLRLAMRWRSQAGSTAGPPQSRSFQARMADAWRGFQGPVLLLLSSEDLTAAEFLEHVAKDSRWAGLLERPKVRRVDLAGADHTFSVEGTQEEMQRWTSSWLREEFSVASMANHPRREFA